MLPCTEPDRKGMCSLFLFVIIFWEYVYCAVTCEIKTGLEEQKSHQYMGICGTSHIKYHPIYPAKPGQGVRKHQSTETLLYRSV